MNSVLRSATRVLLFGSVFFTVCLLCAGSPSSDWTDRKEYDLVLTIRSETTPQKRLDLLETWSRTYPKSHLSKARLELYLATYETLGDSSKMFETARQILANQPNDPVGLYWSTLLLPKLQDPNPEAIDAGVKSAKSLISGLETYFAVQRKPASVTAADWQKQKSAVEVLGHRTIGWASWQLGDFAAADAEFTTCLEKDPHDTEISAWLGIVLALETGKQVPALWHLARGSRVEPGGTLLDDQRRQVNTLFEHMYASYHGGTDGIDELRTASAASAFPPKELAVDPAMVMAARRAEAELAASNPELAAWMSIRRQLDAADGGQFFTSSLESKPLPRLKGTVVRGTPARSPREFMLAMTEGGGSEVILTIKSSLLKYAGPGSTLMFRGTAESFTREPFALHVSANPADVEVLPGR